MTEAQIYDFAILFDFIKHVRSMQAINPNALSKYAPMNDLHVQVTK